MFSNLIAGLDIGSTNIRACVCRIDPVEGIKVLGLENTPSTAVKTGCITDMNLASKEISSIMRKLERRIGKRITHVSVAISGPDINVVEANGMVALGKRPREIWQHDIDKCIRVAKMVHLPENKQVIISGIHSFYINERDLSYAPLGLYGTKLSVKLFIVYAGVSCIKNLHKSIEHSGFILDAIVPYSTAISEACIISDKESPTLLIDIGGHSTDISIVEGGAVIWMQHISEEADSLNTFMDIKNYLNYVKESLYGRHFKKLVITGGGALKENLIEAAEKIFEVPTELGRVKIKNVSLNPSDSVIHTASLGTVVHRANELGRPGYKPNIFRKGLKMLNNVLEDYF